MDELPIIDNTTSLKLYFKNGLQQLAPLHRIEISSLAVEYLANTLTNFARSENLFRNYSYGVMERSNSLEPLTMLALSAAIDSEDAKRSKAQMVGNECLFLVGFFYEYLLNKCGEGLLRHHGELGSGAYQRAAELSKDGVVFSELSRNFWEIADVVRDLDQTEINKHKLLKLHRRYLLGESNWAMDLNAGKFS